MALNQQQSKKAYQQLGNSLVKTIVLTTMVGFVEICQLAAQSTNQPQVVEFKLDDYIKNVVQNNETLQGQMVETEVSRQKLKAEHGIYEPIFDASVTREANRRTNDVAQLAAQNDQAYFNERNTIYDSGIETLVPTGGKIRLGYTLSDLANNINSKEQVYYLTNLLVQYQTFVGATFTQPLLKNGWFSTTSAGIRLAELDSDIAFEQYRQQLMLTISQAENAYWNLYFAQEQLRFCQESVVVEKNILDDTQEKLKVGQSADLDVMEAKSGLAQSESRLNDAQQYFYDAQKCLINFTGTSQPANLSASSNPVTVVHVSDEPCYTNTLPKYADGLQNAFVLNPDYRIQQKKMYQEEVRQGVARNQMLPELNLNTAYGFNGLGMTPGDSWEVAQSQDFPSWSVGLELSVPLAGNIKGRNLLYASKLKLQEAYVNLKAAQTEMANGLITSLRKANAWQQSIQSYRTIEEYDQALLNTQLARLKAGTVEAQKVLDVEKDLLNAHQEFANALVQYQRTLLQVALNAGTILNKYNLDITRDELRQRTAVLLKRMDAPIAASTY